MFVMDWNLARYVKSYIVHENVKKKKPEYQ